KDYGTCECFLAPRTCDQHRKYRYLIPNPKENWEWTATAYSTESNGYSGIAYLVTCAGGLDSYHYSYGAGAVRPLFKLNPDTITATIPKKKAEPQMPSKTELCEHEFDDLYYCSDDYQVTRKRNVWVSRSNGFKKKRLVYCKKCGQVFVKEFEKEGK